MAKQKSPLDTITSADPSSLEWQNAFDQLSPQDQQQIFNFTYNSPMTEDTSQMGDTGGVGPSLDPSSMALTGYMGGVNIPQFTSAGKLDPFDLGQAQAQLNLAQDLTSSNMDLGMAGMFGPGAIDPSVFAPKVTMPTTVVKTPNLDVLKRYASGTGYRAFLAQRMLPTTMGGKGMTDDEALSDLWAQVNAPATVTASQQQKDQQQRLINSLPANTYQQDPVQAQLAAQLGYDPTSGSTAKATGTAAKQAVSAYDTKAVTSFASDLFSKSTEDQAAIDAGWTDPSTGKTYTEAPTQEESYATTRFHNAGLPTPVERYTDPKYTQMFEQTYMPTGRQDYADQLARQADAETEFKKAQTASRQADVTNTNLQQAYTDWQGRRQANQQAIGQVTAAQGLRNAMQALPESAAAVAPPRQTAPAINLGGRITGTKPLGNYNVTAGLPPARPAPTPTGNALMQQTQAMGGWLAPLQASLQPENQPWVVDQGGGNIQMFKNQDEATKNAGLHNLQNAIYNFMIPEDQQKQGYKLSTSRQPQALTSRQVGQAQTAKQAADRRFVQANTNRFRNSVAQGVGTQDFINAVVAAQNSRTTPYQDATMQRRLGLRAMGFPI